MPDKPNDAAMKAAEVIEECLSADINGALHRTFGTTPDATVDKKIKIAVIKSLIEDVTHLSAKETALRELVEVVDWDWLLRYLADALRHEIRTRPGRETHRLIRAALAKAGKVLKL